MTIQQDRRRSPHGNENIGMLLLAIYLILVGLMGIFSTTLGAASILLLILALVAGVMILLGEVEGASKSDGL